MAKYTARRTPSEASMRARRWRGRIERAIVLLTIGAMFCCLIGTMMGVPQSFLGQWWMRPPRYPGAVEVKFAVGEVCAMPAPAVYCYEHYYRTPDPVETVVAYYQNLEWWNHPPIAFEWRRGRRFSENWVAESCIHIISSQSCYQIIVHPSGEGDTEIYILEIGGMGKADLGE